MSDRIKVLHTVPLGSGGVTSFVLNLAESIDKSQVSIDFLTFFDRKEFAEDRALKTGGVKYIVPKDRYKNPILRATYKFFKSIKVIRKSQADILHLNTSNPYDVMIGIAAKIGGVKKVFFHSHHSGEQKLCFPEKILRCIFKHTINLVSDGNFACSDEAAKFLYTSKVFKKRNYTVINNGIPTEKYLFSKEIRDQYRKKLNLQSQLIIGHIGRFIEAKNHNFLLRVFQAFHTKNPNSVLLLIGEGPLERQTKNLVAELQLGNCVVFYGTTHEIPELLQVMDCFVMPSLHEGLPVSGVEAQAAGLPVLVSDTVTQELNVSGLVHYLSLDKSAEDWANEIEKYVVNGASHSDREKGNLQVRASGFDVVCIAQYLLNLYQSSLK